MAYRFKQNDKSVQKGVRRIARRELEKAVAEIDDQAVDDAATVHQIRKRCKKLRGLIRLVRPAFPDYFHENAAFRNAAQSLSGIRDAEVMTKTYDALMDTYAGEVDRSALAPLRRVLTARVRDAQAADTLSERLDLFRQNMVAAQERVRNWKIKDEGFDAVGAGLSRTFATARKAMAHAHDERTAESMHEWRKRVKYHWYHTRLLEPCFPAALSAHKKATKRLGALLGDHHDLAVFIETLGWEEIGDAERRSVIVALATQRQSAIEAEAFPLGARLFAEPAGDLADRWERWWEIWHAEKELPAAA